ncbi:Aldolase (modular protein) [Beijerinckiaceae bacterium RH AL1]|nr:serine kinase [Beijerinckiaceae bacterium]VVB44333.1 Aldolase (modular protein) [Beijerinckiaceae bacterium RH CH11]VVB44413.1 Aldolase (modular protein) [Beijerinckiaceae bacterium RH AL8]VVC54302.1 Aldolase (modular protein) [Beijerinckiaceae bacterium RH AL1]
MPAEGARAPLAIHATAVAIGDQAVLIRGASCAGKSRLALALIARATPAMPIRLVGDDRILLHSVAEGLVACPHPRIAGFVERRGLGLVAMQWVARAKLGGIVDLGSADAAHPRTEADRRDPLPARMPRLALECAAESERAERVLAWWAGLGATSAPHPPEKALRPRPSYAKD